jgi:hypothetical protein
MKPKLPRAMRGRGTLASSVPEFSAATSTAASSTPARPFGRFGGPGHRALVAVSTALVLGASACATTDYSETERYYAYGPKSILIVPVRNQSTDAEAGRYFLSTISRPLALRGYYVLPIESSFSVLEREGVADEGLAWSVEPRRWAEFLGADAVLYITIESWDTSYIVISSSVSVGLHYRLVATRTGDLLWEHRAVEVESSGSSGGGGGGAIGLAVALTAAAVSAAVTAATTDYVPLAARANERVLLDLPPGPYHAEYEAMRARVAEWRAEKNREEAEAAAAAAAGS